MNAAVRNRVWLVMEEWFGQLGGGAIIMVWRDPKIPSGQMIRILGEPPVELVDVDGVTLSRRPLTESEIFQLAQTLGGPIVLQDSIVVEEIASSQ